MVQITYFVPDRKKAGGVYIDIDGIVKKIDDFGRIIVMKDETKIPIDDIIKIDFSREDR